MHFCTPFIVNISFAPPLDPKHEIRRTIFKRHKHRISRDSLTKVPVFNTYSTILIFTQIDMVNFAISGSCSLYADVSYFEIHFCDFLIKVGKVVKGSTYRQLAPPQ